MSRGIKLAMRSRRGILMTGKHIRGPWEASQEWPKNIADTWYVHDALHGIQIAEIYGKANAHLIAASLDLLEACEEALTHLEDHLTAKAKILTKMRAVIAKARAET